LVVPVHCSITPSICTSPTFLYLCSVFDHFPSDTGGAISTALSTHRTFNKRVAVVADVADAADVVRVPW
jgi:hypothetical protein